MTINLRKPDGDGIGFLFAMAAVIFGGWVRIFPALLSDYPINDGGLFFQIIETLHQTGIKTAAIQYNGLQIPFAYPPLGFYLAVWLKAIFRFETLTVLHWLPVAITICTLPAFIVLARALLGSWPAAGVASLFYAFTPRAFVWLIMGGGLTRSLGQLFLLLACHSLYLLFSHRSRRALAGTVTFSALVILSHPEAAVHTLGAAVILWLFYGRSRSSFRDASLAGLGVIFLTAIWWIPLLLRLGTAPLLSAFQTGLYNPFSILTPLATDLTGEPVMTFTMVFTVIGAALQIARRNYFLPVWFLAIFLIEPRSASTVSMIPAAMLAGLTACEIIEPGLRIKANSVSQKALSPSFVLLILFIGINMAGGAFYAGTRTAGKSVTTEERSAFEWISTNTPPESRFVLLTGNTDLFSDGTQEWFPVLTHRISLTTVQGREWIDGGSFAEDIHDLQGLQKCLASTDSLQCTRELLAGMHLDYDYLGILRNPRSTDPAAAGNLLAALNDSDQYLGIYKTDAIAIYSPLEQ